MRLTSALSERYRVERELGAGGMATVYLAVDVRHDRKVAIKVLHAELAAVIGAERFLSEIRTTANLQHPHILGLIDSGEMEGIPYYVMPFVEGESLRDRLNRETQLPIQDALRLTSEIASALDFAHRHGVIHRDVKPENILIQDGSALVADFGIALAVSSAGGQRLTQTGLSLGTPAYMSPEQAMGEKSLDARTDVYALGAVLYEMLGGEPPFTGPTAQAIVARVMTERPRPIGEIRDTVPPNVAEAVHRALSKLAADRFASAREFREALDDRGATADRRRPAPAPATAPAAPKRWSLAAIVPWAIAAAAVAAAVGALWSARPRAPGQPLHASIEAPTGCTFGTLSERNLVQLSPTGADLAVVAECGGQPAIWIRSLVTGRYRRLDGTTGALYPFWSPDGHSLGFFAGGRLKRIDLESGAIRDLAPALQGRGGSWSANGVILFAPDVFAPLHRIPADGGQPEPATLVTGDSDRTSDRLPMFLAGGRQFLFARATGNLRSGVPMGQMLVGELDSRDTRVLLDEPSNVALSAGHLLFVQRGVLIARPFDTGRAEFTGAPVAIVPGIEVYPFRALGQYAAAGDRLIYRTSSTLANRLILFDPDTRSVTPLIEGAGIQSVRGSPDGKWLLATRRQGDGHLVDPWLYERATGRWTRISATPALYYILAWAPDSREFITASSDDSTGVIRQVDLTPVRTLSGSTAGNIVETWHPSGAFALGTRQSSRTGFDIIRVRPDDPDSRPEAITSAPSDEQTPRISPDGRLVLLRSNETGRDELFVASLPNLTGRVQLSLEGVSTFSIYTTDIATWSRDGRAIYFVQADGQLMKVAVGPPGAGRFGRAEPVAGAPRAVSSLDVDPDGRLLLLYGESSAEVPLTLVDRWTMLATKP